MSSLVDIHLNLAREVRDARERALLTQLELAERLGVAARTLQNWEAGTAFPQARHRRALAAFFETLTKEAA